MNRRNIWRNHILYGALLEAIKVNNFWKLSRFVSLKVRCHSAGYFYGEESFSTTLPKQKSHLDRTTSEPEQTSPGFIEQYVFYYIELIGIGSDQTSDVSQQLGTGIPSP